MKLHWRNIFKLNANYKTFIVLFIFVSFDVLGQAINNNATSSGGITISSGCAINCNGTIINTAGNLTNNGKITLSGNWTNNGGTVSQGSGTVTFTGNNAMTINGSSASQTFDNLTVNNTAGAILNSNITVNGTLTLTSGNIDIGSHTITTAAISGGSSSSYIVTSSVYNATAGYLKIVGVGSNVQIVFPVGSTTGSYTPCYIQNSGTSQDFSVRVFPGVYSNGLSGTSQPDLPKILNRTWEISPTIQTGINAKITLQWNSAEEGSTFASKHSTAFIAKNRHTTGDNNWHQLATSSITGSGPFQMTTSTGLSTFSTFSAGTINSSLPIELSQFKVQLKDQYAEITWTTETETNNNEFTIEKSIDGIHWIDIYTCDGAGTSTLLHNYSYTDNNPSLGNNYYRLKQSDFDGNYTYSSIEAITSTKNAVSVKIYPIPAKASEMNILIQSRTTGIASIIITDLSGKQVCKGEIESYNRPQIIKLDDICPIEAGFYYIKITNNDSIIMKKIIIE
jgi:hypothetical protein